MYVIHEDPKTRAAVLHNIAASAIEQYDAMPARMDDAVAKAKARGTPRPILLLRSAMIQYLGAAYFFRDRERFRVAAAAITSHSAVLVSAFAPERSLFETDLCLVLLGGPASTRRLLVQTAAGSVDKIDPADARGRLVTTLALLADLDRDGTEAEIDRLRTKCEQGVFDRQETSYLQPWLRVARGAAAGAAHGSSTHSTPRTHLRLGTRPSAYSEEGRPP